MTKGIDTTASDITVAELEAGGYDFICRYILDAPGGQKKQITKAEVSRFTLGGKRICSNFEWGENPPDTVAEGKAHANAFLDWAADFHAPDWSPCYFSLDRNNPAGKYVNYFRGVCDVIGPERSGMYGNGACYRHLQGLKLISYAWQSKSSSYAGNNTTTGANVVQQLKTATVGGHTVDVDIAQTALYGGWLLGEENPIMATLDDDDIKAIRDAILNDPAYGDLAWRVQAMATMRDTYQAGTMGGSPVAFTAAIKALPTTAGAVDVAKLAAALAPLLTPAVLAKLNLVQKV